MSREEILASEEASYNTSYKFTLQFRRERQESDIARTLDGFAEPALVARARPGHAARQNFSALLHERLKHLGFFVVDEVHVLDAKAADFLLAKILALSATARTAGTAPGSSGAARTAAFTALSSSASRMAFGAARWSARVSLGAMRGTGAGARSCARCFW